MTRLSVLLAVVPAAGCLGTAVDVLERADAAVEAEIEGDADADADADADGGEDRPAEDGDAGPCRAGVDGDCPPGELCDVRGCDSGATGTCVAAPGACPAGLDPVCACDGATYWNDCERLLQRAAWRQGGACAGATCVPSPLDSCAIGEVCAWSGCFPPSASTCVVRPSTCASSGTPTCGCDGSTYGNPCAALEAGFPLDHPGECTSLSCTPVCETVAGVGLAWRDPCTGDTICPADCTDCAPLCELSGTPMEGWYTLCLPDLARDGGCGDFPNVIRWGSCGS